MYKLPERIRQLRKSMKMTQQQIGEKANVSSQVISNWERGYSFPDHEDIRILAQIFQTTTDYLLGNIVSSEEHLVHVDESLFVKTQIIDLESLTNYQLIYKGHKLSIAETSDLQLLIDAAISRWTK